MIETIAKTIIWMAEERMKEQPVQNINSAIHAVKLEITQYLMEYMKDVT
jgi:hypothetical protein